MPRKKIIKTAEDLRDEIKRNLGDTGYVLASKQVGGHFSPGYISNRVRWECHVHVEIQSVEFEVGVYNAVSPEDCLQQLHTKIQEEMRKEFGPKIEPQKKRITAKS